MSLRLDGEKGFGITMAKKFMPSSYPTFLIFDAHANLLHISGGGGDNAGFFLQQMREMIKPVTDTIFSGVTKNMNLAYPDFYNAFYEHRKQPDPAVVQNYLKTQTDWLTEVNWSVVNTFSRFIPTYKDWSVAHAKELKSMYGVSIETDPLNKLIYELDYAVSQRDIKGFDLAIEKMETLNNSRVNPQLAERIRFNKLRFYAQTNQNNKFKEQVTRDIKEHAQQYTYLSVRLLGQESRDSTMLNYALGLLPAAKNNDEFQQQLLILYFLDRTAEADQLIKSAAPDQEFIQQLTSSLAARAIDSSNPVLLAEAQGLLNHYHVSGSESIILRYQINYFIHTEQWNEMSLAVEQLLNLKENDLVGREIIEYTYYVSQYSNNPIVLKRAIKWIKPLATITSELQTIYLNAYATLLFKNGQYKEAGQWAEKLLSLTANSADEEASARELILKIKAKSSK